jgi:hypothetical protein
MPTPPSWASTPNQGEPEWLDAIEESPEGPEICAIFDFDGTIISGYSAIAFIREQLRRGDLSARDFSSSPAP